MGTGNRSSILNIFTAAGFGSVMEVLFLILQILYVAFAFIMIRQTKIMNASFQTALEPLIRSAVIIHFVAAIGVVFASLMLLIL